MADTTQCKVQVKFTATTDAGDTQESEAPLSDLMDAAEAEDQEDNTDGDGNPIADKWQERDRKTEALELPGGVEVDRITEVEFEKPSGKRIRLIFDESENHDGGGA